jgi:hypothetical protein
VPCEWPGETAFVIGGGPSVLGQDLEVLRGRRIIVINSSVHTVPWADFMFFSDARWWNEPENRAAVESFAGRVVTTSRMVPNKNMLVCRRSHPPGLALERDMLMRKWTSLTAATNLAAHLVGSGGTIVWLGADGQKAADGRTHHHKPHRWAHTPGCYDLHRKDLVTIVPSLKALEIAGYNASPDTAWADILPVVGLQDVLTDRRSAA